MSHMNPNIVSVYPHINSYHIATIITWKGAASRKLARTMIASQSFIAPIFSSRKRENFLKSIIQLWDSSKSSTRWRWTLASGVESLLLVKGWDIRGVPGSCVGTWKLPLAIMPQQKAETGFLPACLYCLCAGEETWWRHRSWCPPRNTGEGRGEILPIRRLCAYWHYCHCCADHWTSGAG